MKLDRSTLIAALVTLAAATPVYLVMRSISERLFPPTAAGEPPVVAIRAPAREPVPAAAPHEPGPLAQVTGTLRTPDGSPVPDELVELFSRSLDAGFFATSDAKGRFEIPDVAQASDYVARVSTEGRYRAYEQPGIVVGPEGAALELVIEPLATTARLEGRMVDAEGVPLPQRTLRLETSDGRAQLHVTGDDRGHFLVEDAPPGHLTFTTNTVPRVKVRGPLLTPASHAEVLLVLDQGRHDLSGRVVGDRDAPVSGARLELSWTHEEGESVSSSARTAVTDPDGTFRFTDLGPGPHQLAVQAEGYQPLQGIYNVSWNSDVEVRLTPD